MINYFLESLPINFNSDNYTYDAPVKPHNLLSKKAYCAQNLPFLQNEKVPFASPLAPKHLSNNSKIKYSKTYLTKFHAPKLK
jgi:hypothetical protein